MALLCSAAVRVAPLRLCFYLLFYLLLISIFTHITTGTDHLRQKYTLGHWKTASLTWFRTLYHRIHRGLLRFFGTRREQRAQETEKKKHSGNSAGIRNRLRKGLTVLLYRAFCSLMSNPWRIRWTILEPG